MLNQKLVVDFDELEGDLIFSTGNLYDRLIIEIDEILGLSETYFLLAALGRKFRMADFGY